MTRTHSRLGLAATVTALAALITTPLAEVSATPASATTSAPSAAPTALANLDHLDWLGARVVPPQQVHHTTYRLGTHPRIGVLWTYAENNGDGTFRRVGGGDYDAPTNTYAQGAYNADDMARAAVVYLRHWKQTGATSSRSSARQMLRGLTYLQTTTGRNAGNVVLWMQPDGSLHRSVPGDLPDPSDSAASYWLARSIWALGEGYADFKAKDQAFARFLKRRLDLAVRALDRQVLNKYHRYLMVDGRRAPAWLVADGADASAEAVFGLSAYVEAGGTSLARKALSQLSEGIADLAGGSARRWPFGAIRPGALSLSDWHAWAAQMPAALARASTVLGEKRLATRAARDSFTFDPWMLTSGGPDNGRLPTRVDGSQIAYGVDARVESLIATADATQRGGAKRLAGMVAAWFFGANAAGRPMYDPSTGVTFDGVSADGVVNENSGAESTIHGLLAMLALDQHPVVARTARTASVITRVGSTALEAEDGTLSPEAQVVQPAKLWTGESQYGGTGYVALVDGASETLTLPGGRASLVMPVFDLRHGSSAVTTFSSQGRRLGAVRSGEIGTKGASPARGALLPRTLRQVLPAGATQLTATTAANGTDRARLDAVMIEPLVSRLVLGGHGHGTALLRSAATTTKRAYVVVPGSGPARILVYDGTGHLLDSRTSSAQRLALNVPPGGFIFIRR